MWSTLVHAKFLEQERSRSNIKKGDKEDPANYRPIALLSHPLKVIESAIDSTIRRPYKFYRSKYGFQHGIGTEAAILKAVDLQNNCHKFSVILDLKSAYDRVLRDKLINILRAKLSDVYYVKYSHYSR